MLCSAHLETLSLVFLYAFHLEQKVKMRKTQGMKNEQAKRSVKKKKEEEEGDCLRAAEVEWACANEGLTHLKELALVRRFVITVGVALNSAC